MTLAAVHVRASEGLHYVEGLPRWAEYAWRAVVFLLGVVAVGALLGGIRRGRIHPGLWWVGLACLLTSARAVWLQLVRWEVPITLESSLTLPILLALLYGIHLRVRDGSMGQAD